MGGCFPSSVVEIEPPSKRHLLKTIKFVGHVSSGGRYRRAREVGVEVEECRNDLPGWLTVVPGAGDRGGAARCAKVSGQVSLKAVPVLSGHFAFLSVQTYYLE